MNTSVIDNQQRRGAPAPAPGDATEPARNRNHSISYLRAFLVALVVAHHAILAYHTFAPPAAASLLEQPRWWPAFPVVDTGRWVGFDLFAGFNDTFLMSLFFFLSGLFVWDSLRRKGSSQFLSDRLRRLGVPFIVAAAILAPLAYYPAYLRTPGEHAFTGFWEQWLALGSWPVGPAWFLAVLLLFDAFAVMLSAGVPRWGEVLGKLVAGSSRRPVVFFALLVAVSALAYVPMALKFGPLSWVTFGPFAFQTSRIIHYLAYFMFGVAVGACGFERGLLRPDGKLARRWPLWGMTALTFYGVAVAIVVITATAHPYSPSWAAAGAFAFVVSCASASLAFLALFLRLVRKPSGLLNGLSANSYAVYLLHYAIANWLLYVLLPVSLPVPAKGAIAIFAALGSSWAASAALRRIPAAARWV
jgi:peptidoglycan/LPS O-acetylase OafA/YrhL